MLSRIQSDIYLPGKVVSCMNRMAGRLMLVALVSLLIAGCGKKEPEPEPKPTPAASPAAQVSVPPTSTPTPEPTATPTPTPKPIRVSLPSWLEADLRKAVDSRLGEAFSGREIIPVSADDPAQSNGWDVRLAPVTPPRLAEPGVAPWLLDTLQFYTNGVFLTQHGILKPGASFEEILEQASKAPASGTAEFIIALPGDVPALPRTIQSLALIAGATSDSSLTSRPVVKALDYLASLNRKGLFPIGHLNGFSSRKTSQLISEGRAGMTLGWETEMGWLTDIRRSGLGIKASKVPFFSSAGTGASRNYARMWCWEAAEPYREDPQIEAGLNKMAAFDPGDKVTARWIGGATQSVIHPISELFLFENIPGQDARATSRVISEGWSSNTPSKDILYGLQTKFAADAKR